MMSDTSSSPASPRARSLRAACAGAAALALLLAAVAALKAPKVELWREDYAMAPASALRDAAEASGRLINKPGPITLQQAFAYNGSQTDPGLPELKIGREGPVAISLTALAGARDTLRAQSDGYAWHLGEEAARSPQGLAALKAAADSMAALQAAVDGPTQTLDPRSALLASLSFKPGLGWLKTHAPWARAQAEADPEFRRRVDALGQAALKAWTPPAALAATLAALAPLAAMGMIRRRRRARARRASLHERTAQGAESSVSGGQP